MTEASSAPTKRPSRLRRLARILLRTVGILTVLALVASVLLQIFPVPIPGLPARLEAILSEQVGAPVTIDSAHLWAFDRQLRVRGITVSTTGEPLEIDQAVVELRWKSWRVWEALPDLIGAQIRGVSGAEIVFDEGGMTLQRDGVQLVEWGGVDRGEPFDLMSLEVPTLRVSNADVHLIERRSSGVDSLVNFENVTLDVASTSSGLLRLIRWQGQWRTSPERVRPFRGSLERTPDGTLMLVLHIEGFDTQEFILLPSDLHIMGESLNLHSLIDLTPGNVAIETSVSGDEMRWGFARSMFDSEIPFSRSENQPHAQFRLAMDSHTNEWVLEESSFTVGPSRVEASGRIGRSQGWPMNLTVTTEHADLALEVINQLIYPYGAEIRHAALGLEINFQGLLGDLHDLETRGRIDLTDGDVLFSAPSLPSGGEFEGSINFYRDAQSEEYHIQDVSGNLGSVALSVASAEITRQMAVSEEMSYLTTADVWASGEVTDWLAMLPVALETGPLTEISGSLTAEGRVQQTLWPNRSLRDGMVTNPVLDGTLTIENAIVQGITGEGVLAVPRAVAQVTSPRLSWTDQAFTWNGRNLRTSGSVSSDEAFWRDGALNCTATTNIDLADVEMSTLALPDSVQIVTQPSGHVGVGIRVSGPIDAPDQLNRSYLISLDSVEVTAANRGDLYRAVIESGDVDVTPQRIHFSHLPIDLNDLPIDLSGVVTAIGCTAEATIVADGQVWKDALPRALDNLLLGGPISGEFTFAATAPIDRALDAAATNWDLTQPEAIRDLSQRLGERVAAWQRGEAQRPFEIHGLIQVNDGMVTPVNSPADITHVYGMADWDGQVFRCENATAQAGSIENVTLRSGVFDMGNPVQITLDLHAPDADLTDWIKPWIRRDWLDLTPEERHELSLSHGRPDRVIHTRATIETDATWWHNLQGGPSRAILEQEFDRAARTNILRVEPIRLEGYSGRIDGIYRLTITDLGQTHETHLNVTELDLEPFLTDLRGGNPTQVQGRLTGVADLLVQPGNTWMDLTGLGRISVAQSSLMRSTLFRELGRLTGVNAFDDISFSAITADLEIGDHQVNVSNLFMDTTWTDITGEGTVGFDRTIGFNVRFETMPSVFQGIPVVGWLSGLVDTAINKVLLSVRVGGTLDEPQVRIVQPIVQPIVDTILGAM